MHTSTATIRYYTNWAIALVDKELARYYVSQLPKYLDYNTPKYEPHITVVRKGKETVTDTTAWNKHEGEVIEFAYEHRLYTNGLYFWLKAHSVRLEEIREELGLPRIREPFAEFHITIANLKRH